jgi:hypothetical protein
MTTGIERGEEKQATRKFIREQKESQLEMQRAGYHGCPTPRWCVVLH